MIIPISRLAPSLWASNDYQTMDPLSSNLIGGYNLVIPITNSFYGLNNLEDLVKYLRE